MLSSTIEFDTAVAIGTLDLSWGVTAGDFDNDGHLDLAVVLPAGSVEILLGDGAGAFTSAGSFAVQTLPREIIAADFNDNGMLDLAVLNTGTNDVSILLGNGDGTFADAVDYALVGEARSFAVADVNQNGVLDIVANSGATGAIVTLLGNGDGTFQDSELQIINQHVTKLILADLDGQNGPDLIYTVEDSNTLRVRYNQGDGTFGAQTTYDVASGPRDLVAVDLDLDGHLDVIVVGTGTIGVQALSVMRNDGTGALTKIGDLDLPASAASLIAPDLNGDRLADLAVLLNTGETAILAGDGAGGFVHETTLTPVDGTPTRLAWGDFAGNGAIDLVSADSAAHGLSLFVNVTPAPNPAPAVPDLDPASDLGFSDNDNITSQSSELIFHVADVPEGATARLYHGSTIIGEAIAVAGTATIITDVGTFDDGVYHITAAYHDGDTLSARSEAVVVTIDATPPQFISQPDLLVPIGPEYVYDAQTDKDGVVEVRYSLVTGPDDMVIDEVTGVLTWTPLLEDFGDHEVVITVMDLAGNVAEQEFTLRAETILTLAEATTHALPGDAWAVTTGDFTGNGYDDVAVSFLLGYVMIFTSNGDGTLTSGDFYNVGASPRAILAVDLDGDGHLDLVTANYQGNSISVLLGNGDGTFQEAVNYGAGAGPISLAYADLDGENGPDLIVVNSLGNSVSVLLNNGDGTFADATNFGVGSNPRGIAIGDHDKDGRIDVFVTSLGQNFVTILKNDGAGNLTHTHTLATASNPYGVALVDMNNDGWLDVVTANWHPTQGLSILINDQEGGFAGATHTSVGSRLDLLATADMNGDGPVDLIVGTSNGIARILQNDTLGGVETPYNLAGVASPQALAAADLNGDGMPDLVALLDNELMLFVNESTAPPPAPAAPILPPAFDTGASDSDGVTSFNNAVGEPINFWINDVIEGATVSLYANGVLLGQAVAVGSFVAITTDADSPDTVLADGVHTLRVYQTYYATSVASLPTTIVVDTIAPTITSRPVRFAGVDDLYQYDVESDEEGNEGVVYTLIAAPAGMTIEANTGLIEWTPTDADRGVAEVTVRVTDLAGNLSEQSFTIGVLAVTGADIPDLGDDGIIEMIPGNFDLFDPDSDRVRIRYTGSGSLFIGRLYGHVEYIVAVGDINTLGINVRQGPGGDGELHVGSIIADSIARIDARDLYITGGTVADFDGQLLIGSLANARIGGVGRAVSAQIGETGSQGLRFQAVAIETSGDIHVDGLVRDFTIRGDFSAGSIELAGGVVSLQVRGDWVTTGGAVFGQALPGIVPADLPLARRIQFRQDVDGPISIHQQEVRRFEVRGETLDSFALTATDPIRTLQIRGEMNGTAALDDVRQLRLDNVVGDISAGETSDVRFQKLSGSLTLGESRRVQARDVLTGTLVADSISRFTARDDVTDATIRFTLAAETVNDKASDRFDVRGRTTNTTITSSAGMGQVQFNDALINSSVLVGVASDYDPADGLPAPDTAGILVGAPARIDRFIVQSSTDFAFRGSIVIAHLFGDIDLGHVFLNNEGAAFGVGAHAIDSLTLTYPTGGGTFRGEAAFLLHSDTYIDFQVNKLAVNWS